MKRSTASYIWMTALAAIVVAAAGLLVASRADKPREIRLVARDMTFYVEGSEQPNPAITVRAGEQVRVVLRNEDAGMSHDFAVRDWNVGTKLLEDKGQEAVVEFRAPAKPGTHEYNCTPHATMMKGAIRVE